MWLLSTPVKIALSAWLIAEALVFVLVVGAIGFPAAVLVGVLTSLVGWTLLKRAGSSAMIKLRAALDGRRTVDGAPQHFVDETLATVGAIALLVPGFLSDVVGLALAVPAIRDRTAGWLDRRGGLARWQATDGERRSGPAEIDLEPDQWRRTETASRPASKL